MFTKRERGRTFIFGRGGRRKRREDMREIRFNGFEEDIFGGTLEEERE